MSKLKGFIAEVKELMIKYDGVKILLVGTDDKDDCVLRNLCPICAREILDLFIGENEPKCTIHHEAEVE